MAKANPIDDSVVLVRCVGVGILIVGFMVLTRLDRTIFSRFRKEVK